MRCHYILESSSYSNFGSTSNSYITSISGLYLGVQPWTQMMEIDEYFQTNMKLKEATEHTKYVEDFACVINIEIISGCLPPKGRCSYKVY